MDEAKKLVLNIVTWNSSAYIPNLLASLNEQDTHEFTVTVVDNASSDGTLTWLQANRPDVAVLRNFRNQGFSRAHNQAIALALSRWSSDDLAQRYVLVTNPDLEFATDSLRLLTDYMDTHPEVAMCTPKLLRAYAQSNGDPEARETVRSNVIDSTGLVITKSRRVYDRGAGEDDHGQHDQATDVFGVSGACMMLRASAVVAAMVSGEFFDEDIFAYQEDIDVAWRMRRLGFEARYVPHVTVWHHRRVPSDPKAGWFSAWRARRSRSPFVNFLSTRNHGWVLLKNEELGTALMHAPWWLPYECAKCLGSLTSWSALKGQAACLAGARKMLTKRGEIAGRATVVGPAMRRWFV